SRHRWQPRVVDAAPAVAAPGPPAAQAAAGAAAAPDPGYQPEVPARLARPAAPQRHRLRERQLRDEAFPAALEVVHGLFAEGGDARLVAARIRRLVRADLLVEVAQEALLLQVVHEVARLRVVHAGLVAVELLRRQVRERVEALHAAALDRALQAG